MLSLSSQRKRRAVFLEGQRSWEKLERLPCASGHKSITDGVRGLLCFFQAPNTSPLGHTHVLHKALASKGHPPNACRVDENNATQDVRARHTQR